MTFITGSLYLLAPFTHFSHSLPTVSGKEQSVPCNYELFLFFRKNMLECIRILIENGANVYGGASRTELYFKLLELQSPELMDLIWKNREDFDVQKLANLNLVSTWAKIVKDKKLFNYFFDNVLDVNLATEDDKTTILKETD